MSNVIKNFSCYTTQRNENKKVLSKVLGEIITKIKNIQNSIQKFILKEKEIVTFYEQQKTKINSLFANISRKIENIKKSYIERINFLYSEQEKLFSLNQHKITLFNDKINKIQNVYENININDVDVIQLSKDETNFQLDNIIKDFNDFFHSTSSNMMIFPYFLPPSQIDISAKDFGEIKYTNDISVTDANANWLNMSECVLESNDWGDSLSHLKNSSNIFNRNLFNEIEDKVRLCSVQNVDNDVETSDTEYKACHTAANARAKPPLGYKRESIKTQRNKSKKQLMKEYDDSLETNRRMSNQSAKQSKRNIKIYEKEPTENKKNSNIKIKGRNFSFSKKNANNNNTISTKKKSIKSNNVKIKNNIIPFNNHKKNFK